MYPQHVCVYLYLSCGNFTPQQDLHETGQQKVASGLKIRGKFRLFTVPSSSPKCQEPSASCLPPLPHPVDEEVGKTQPMPGSREETLRGGQDWEAVLEWGQPVAPACTSGGQVQVEAVTVRGKTRLSQVVIEGQGPRSVQKLPRMENAQPWQLPRLLQRVDDHKKVMTKILLRWDSSIPKWTCRSSSLRDTTTSSLPRDSTVTSSLGCNYDERSTTRCSTSCS